MLRRKQLRDDNTTPETDFEVFTSRTRPVTVHVVIFADGAASIEGRAIPPTDVAVQTAVLNLLHERADMLGAPIDATVLDHQRRTQLRVLVHADGASELLGEPQPLAESPPTDSGRPRHTDPGGRGRGTAAVDTDRHGSAGRPTPDEAMSSVSPTPEKQQHTPASGPSLNPLNGTTDPARSSNGGPSTPQRIQSRAVTSPSGPAIPKPSASDRDGDSALQRPTPVAPPSSPDNPVNVTDLMDRVAAAISARDLSLAGILVSRMKQRALVAFGQGHPLTFEAYSFEAYIEHLSGNQERAVSALLNLAELRYRQGDQRAREEMIRATTTWDLITSPVALRILGAELLDLWEQISEGSRSDADEQGMNHVADRLADFPSDAGSRED